MEKSGNKMEKGGNKRAVLVGCNYPKTKFNLYGCINDVNSMRNLIVNSFGFDPSNVQVLTDAPGSSVMPTGANIKAALYAMVKTAKAGDILFFYFSGHGTQVPVLEPGQPFKQDEAIVPCDFNLITDVDFRHFVNRLPKGVAFTFLSDSCHSGGLIDNEKEQIGPNTSDIGPKSLPYITKGKSIDFNVIHDIINIVSGAAHQATNIAEQFFGFFGKDVSLKFNPYLVKGSLDLYPLEDEGILISGCQANETSFDVVFKEQAYGAFTNAVMKVFDHNSATGVSNKMLVMEARKDLKANGYEQNPCLYCNDANVNALFLGGFAHNL